MPTTDPNASAELIASMHQPWRATVAECLQQWRSLDPRMQSGSYLVLHGKAGLRSTLNGATIADLSNRLN